MNKVDAIKTQFSKLGFEVLEVEENEDGLGWQDGSGGFIPIHRVLTNKGWYNVGEYEDGDLLANIDGKSVWF